MLFLNIITINIVYIYKCENKYPTLYIFVEIGKIVFILYPYYILPISLKRDGSCGRNRTYTLSIMSPAFYRSATSF